MKLLNETLDLAYKPELTENELTLYSAIGKELMLHNAAVSGVIPAEFFKIIARHYPNVNTVNPISQLSILSEPGVIE
jgi:hypothetical protein